MENRPVFQSHTGVGERPAEINKVLRNTYMLLSMTLVNSAVFAGIAMAMQIPQGAALIMTIVAFVMLFVIHKTADSAKGLLFTFIFTALLGASLGPMLLYYLSIPNGPSLVMQALGGTALVFFALSGYALTTRKDFSFMGGFLMVGLIVALVGILVNLFLQIPALSLAISGGIVLIMSGLILFDTSRIINGGETNYIRATVALYLDIYNLFIHMLHLLTALSGDE